jgi:sulfite dehydrogenase
LGLHLRTVCFQVLLLVFCSYSAAAGTLKIELPPETASFKPAAGAEIANGQCLICHSVDYVTMQPPMARAFWTASVKKMREKYGSTLPDDQVEPLVGYLTANYGVETNATVASAQQVAPKPAQLTPSLDAQTLATRYGCLGCHNVSVKVVGPSYKDIAIKYHDDAAAFAKVSDQIHKGGAGKWGPVIMPPFPMVTEAETKALADWILSRK